MADSVPDDEILYRRILATRDHLKREGGDVRVSTSAFDDPEQQPSVDLASLCEPLGGLAWTQEGEDNGVVTLATREVREVSLIGKKPAAPDRKPNEPKEIDVTHAVDVHRDPLKADPATGARANPAHAEIRPHPAWCNKSVFKKLKEALARKAQIAVRTLPFR